MTQDRPPLDTEVLSVIETGGRAMDPQALITALSADHSLSNVIEALQRAIERGKITLDADGMVVAARSLAHAA